MQIDSTKDNVMTLPIISKPKRIWVKFITNFIPIKIYRRDNKYLYLRIWRFKTKIWKIRNKK